MNPFEMVVLIVAIVMIASVIKGPRPFGRRHRDPEPPEISVENDRLRQEIRSLHDRIAVLERITVEKENSLDREIEKLRDR